MIYIRPDLTELFANLKTVDDFLNIDMHTVRDFKNRKTGRFELDGQGFYIKKHFECGIGAIADELFHIRKPHIGAGPERSALEKLDQLGIDTMQVAAYGKDRILLNRQRSFLVTDELTNIEMLETIGKNWIKNPPSFAVKKAIISKVAEIARKLHGAGINHRDFYICHFMIDMDYFKQIETSKLAEPKIYLIDLHRACQRSKVPFRWLVKDIGALLFSTLDIGLTKQDYLRFVKLYTGKPIKKAINDEPKFWKAVIKRAIKFYTRDYKKYPTNIDKLIK